MARIPNGADLIENPVSKAPGFQMENVFTMAGIPIIMQAMLESIRHKITGGKPVLSGSIGSFLPESIIAAGLEAIQNDFPEASLGSYPFFRGGKAGTSLVARTRNQDDLTAILAAIRILILDKDGEPFEAKD
jgi:molybdopterin-biosynthesis enzyme MoeA-like protein